MPDWSKLQHAYGAADDLPAILAALTPEPKAEVWNDLWSRVCHQGTVYSASFPTLPYLRDAAAKWEPPARVSPLFLAANIVTSTDIDGPRPSMDEYAPVIRDLHRIAEQTIPAMRAAPVADFIYLLQATLALSGERVWARTLDHLADGEFPGACPTCDANLYLVIGKYGLFATASEWLDRPAVLRHPIEPAHMGELSDTGKWLYDRAREQERAELATWILHVFGATRCPACGTRVSVPAAIEQHAR